MNEFRLNWQKRLVIYLADRILRETGILNPAEFTDSSRNWLENCPATENQNKDKYIYFLEDVNKFLNQILTGKVSVDSSYLESLKKEEWRYLVANWIKSDSENLIPDWLGAGVLPENGINLFELGISDQWKRVSELVEISSSNSVTTLLCGEQGTGKDMIARKLHNSSQRRFYPFVIVPCAALAFEWLRNEWFSNTKAQDQNELNITGNWFRRVEGGTLYLDLIENTPLDTQELLLRFIESLETFDQNQENESKTKIIASTKVPLEDLLIKGKIRKDLYFRLKVFEINLPPLRQRPEDIIPLIYYFAESIAKRHNMIVPAIEKYSLERLKKHQWPGNLRELSAYIEKKILVSDEMVLNFTDIEADLSEIVSSSYHSIMIQNSDEIYQRIKGKGIVKKSELLESIVKFLSVFRGIEFKTSQFAEECNCSIAQARRVLGKLHTQSIIIKRGNKKGTVYIYP